MFSVYKITNLTNGKSYIGSSIRVQKRWKEHKRASQNPNGISYQYPLYRAFRKYGLQNFSFQIIKDDFNTIEEMQQYEKEMIYFYNSCKDGYNQTYQTTNKSISSENFQKYRLKVSQKCAKVDIYNNILQVYCSYHDAAKKNNFDPDYEASHIRKVCKGELSTYHGMYFRDLDENNNIIKKTFKNSHGKRHVVAISVDNPQIQLFFQSISEAANKLNTDRKSIQKCLAGQQRYSIIKGYIIREIDIYGNIIENEINIEDKIAEYNRTNPVINGIRHNIKQWCEIYNISTNAFYKRIKNGMSVIEAITTPKRR